MMSLLTTEENNRAGAMFGREIESMHDRVCETWFLQPPGIPHWLNEKDSSPFQKSSGGSGFRCHCKDLQIPEAWFFAWTKGA